MRDDRQPDDLFRPLRRRPTPELDRERMWRRLRARIEAETPRRVPSSRWIWALAGAGAVILALAIVGNPFGSMPPFEAAAPTDSSGLLAGDPRELVLLEPPVTPSPPGEVEMAATTTWELDVRLVRGYDGRVPADALPSITVGAGGASLLADLRDRLGALLPSFDDFAVVGRWRGGLDEPLAPVALSGAFELAVNAIEAAPGGGTRLTGVRLAGAGRPGVAREIVLHPGRVYLFGVQAPGEDREAGSLVLALQLRPESGN